MKKVFLIFLSLIFIFTFQVKAITLEDITSGKFQSKDIAEVYPSADGVHYFTATNGNTRIVKCEYRTGHEVGQVSAVMDGELDGFIEAITPGSDTLVEQETGLFGAWIAYRANAAQIPELVKQP